MNSPPGSQRARRPPPRTFAAVWLCCLLGCLAWAGCSLQKHHKTLSYFFDGVPDPEAKAKAADAAGVTENIRKSPTYSVHRPYADEACQECHSGAFQLTGQDSSLCMKCHADQTTQHPRMHGPVVVVACLWCHSPHESAEAHLLKKPARQVCSQCHDQTLLDSRRVPEHADPARSCLECHSGHGGKAAFFLLEGVSRPAPAADAREPSPK